MNTEAYKLARATLRTAVKEYGWSRRDPNKDAALGYPVSYTYGPGKFEGEHWSIVHWFDATMNGFHGDEFYSGDSVQWEVFEPTETECEAFGITLGNAIALHYSESGFISMEELTQCQLARLREDYAGA